MTVHEKFFEHDVSWHRTSRVTTLWCGGSRFCDLIFERRGIQNRQGQWIVLKPEREKRRALAGGVLAVGGLLVAVGAVLSAQGVSPVLHLLLIAAGIFVIAVGAMSLFFGR